MTDFSALDDSIKAGHIKKCRHCGVLWKPSYISHRCIAMAEAELQDATDLLCSCADQFLMTNDDGTLHHSYMSTEERLCDYLVSIGKLITVKSGHFRWADAGNDSSAGKANAEPSPDGTTNSV